MTSTVEVEKRRVRDLETVEESPEVMDVATSQRRNGNERSVDRHACSLGEKRYHHFLRASFAEHDEPREVEVRERPDRLTNVGCAIVVVVGQFQFVDDGDEPLLVNTEVTHGVGLDA